MMKAFKWLRSAGPNPAPTTAKPQLSPPGQGAAACTSSRFGPRMYCFAGADGKCQYCGGGMPPPPNPEQDAKIEAGRHETWWRRSDDTR